MVRFISKIALASLCLFSMALTSSARPLEEIFEFNELRIVVYENFPPFSFKKNGKLTGIDVELAEIIGKKLGVPMRLIVREGDEDMHDDLRNSVWKGTLVGGEVGDIMLHVPFDRELEIANPLIVLFGRYYTERMGLLFDPAKTGTSQSLAIFRYQKIGAEIDTLGDIYISSPSTLGGALRDNSVHYRSFTAGIEGIKKQEVAGFIAPTTQLEYAAKVAGRPLNVARPPMPGLARTRWDVGFAVKHDSRDLGYKVQQFMRELTKDGTLDRIFKKYGVSLYQDFK